MVPKNLLNHFIVEDVAIYYFFVPDHEHKINSLAGFLSRDETDRADKYHFQRDKNNFIVCRAILRSIIAEAIDDDPQGIRFTYNEYGKPMLHSCMNRENLQFNISHAGEYGIIALSKDEQIGIDIEKLNIVDNADTIVKSQFSPEEYIHYTLSPDKLKCFYSMWTQKEAVVKASGKGMSFGFRHWSVNPDRNGYTIEVGGDRYGLTHFGIDENYVSALAVKGRMIPH